MIIIDACGDVTGVLILPQSCFIPNQGSVIQTIAIFAVSRAFSGPRHSTLFLFTSLQTDAATRGVMCKKMFLEIWQN